MKASYEKLVPEDGQSFRCFDRSTLKSPVKWHRHPEIELTYLPAGAGSRVVGDHIGSYSDHDLVLLGSELPHTWASDDYRGQTYDLHSAIVLQFHPEFLGQDFFRLNEMVDIHALLQRASRGLWFPVDVAKRIGEQMTELVDLRGARRLVSLLSILDELTYCDESVPLASRLYRTTNNHEVETRIQVICDHITHHLTDPELSHRELATLADMNASAFSRFFKQSTGRTVSAYINELRIGFACRLLTDTDDSILSISQQSGYQNLSNFNRRFLQHRKMTPRDYRNRFRIAV
ncbi:helix-turn-helix domain-containing protein [Aporhodopirellula aestuarii]|uniref:AraC family transcriptional regulator n=1 Tax=Aporhodopirellula aestuarii TaxID=2950107 RepID=A0ABT0U5B4_9BACT|nr:AraC family transcriptional regulator [Aporhodopirellula aestuarii]MCM2372124.1 AraC family transcriptional regulator [Aporhodopirellula aestuarii]